MASAAIENDDRNYVEPEASFYKLKSGAWGVKVAHDVSPGDTVTVTTKSGETKEAVITNVLGKNGYGDTVCEIEGGENEASEAQIAALQKKIELIDRIGGQGTGDEFADKLEKKFGNLQSLKFDAAKKALDMASAEIDRLKKEQNDRF